MLLCNVPPYTMSPSSLTGQEIIITGLRSVVIGIVTPQSGIMWPGSACL